MKKSGFYWLCHHDVLFGWVWDEEERRQYIEDYKPANERVIRQLCFQRVKGKLPEDISRTHKAWEKVEKAGEKAWEKAWKAGEKMEKAREKVREAWEKAISRHKATLEAQFASEYPEAAKYWDGREIVFPKDLKGV